MNRFEKELNKRLVGQRLTKYEIKKIINLIFDLDYTIMVDTTENNNKEMDYEYTINFDIGKSCYEVKISYLLTRDNRMYTTQISLNKTPKK